MKRKLERLLIVGLGSIGTRHFRVVREFRSETKIAILRHKNCNDLANLDLDVNDCFTHVSDALKFQPDAAIIANPASYHLEVAMKLAKAGIHLFIEKPISHNMEGVNELINICKAQGIILMIGYNLRFLPSLRLFRDYINEYKIGNLFYIRAVVGQHLEGWRPGTDYHLSVSAQNKLGGGVLLELSHEIDYLQWLFGKVDWVNSHVSRQSNLQIDVDDTANILIGFKHENKTQQLIANLTMDFIRHDTTRQCIAIGESGTLRWNGVEGMVDYFSANGEGWETLYSQTVERNFTYCEEMAHFFSCIEKNESPLVAGEDGENVLKIVEAVNKSSDTGQRVYIESAQ